MQRFLYILGGILGGLLLGGAVLMAVLTSDRVGTKAVQLVMDGLSRTLGTNVRVGAVQYRFPARIDLQDIYIEDQQHDTLLYLSEIYAHFRPLPLYKGQIVFSHVRVHDGVSKIYKVSEEDPATGKKAVRNYQFLIDAFGSEDESSDKPFKNLVSVRDIQMDNLRVQFDENIIRLNHLRADLNHFTNESLDAQISGLQASCTHPKRVQPFKVDHLEARVILNDTLLALPTLAARLPRSQLDLSGVQVRFPAGDTLYLSQSAHDITFDLDVHEARLVPADIAFFVPRMKGIKRPFTLNGALSGTLDSLAFDHITIGYAGQRVLQGNVSAVGLPDINNPYLHANLQDLHLHAAQLQDFLSQLYARPVKLPKELHRLGDIHYRGLAEGHLHDLTLHGAFRTALGSITTDGSFKSDSLFEHMNYEARVVGRQFKLGRLINHEPLSTVTLDLQSKGSIDHGQISGDVNVAVQQLTYNDYTYNDLTVQGYYEPQRYSGEMAIHDPHLNLDFDGVVDLHDVNPEVNFNLRCNHFDSEPLALPRLGDQLRTHFNLAVDMNGTHLDDLSGYLVVDSLFVATRQDSVLMKQLSLLLSADGQKNKNIALRSDYFTAQADGTFRYADVVPAAKATLHHYLPSAVDAPGKEWQPIDLTFKLNGHRLRDVQRLFIAPITLSDHPTLQAQALLHPEREPDLTMRFFAPGVRAGNTPVHDLTITLNTVDSLRHQGATGSGLALSVSAEALQMHTLLSTLAFHDTLLTHLTLRSEAQIDELLPEGWRDLSPRELQRALSSDLTGKERHQALLAAQRAGNYGGDIQLITHFEKEENKPLIDFHCLPGRLILRDSLYTLGESHITYRSADTSIHVNHFLFEGGGQHIVANGVASPRQSDILEVDLQKIDASYVVPFVLPVQTIMFNGLLTGTAQISSAFKQPQVDTQIHIDSMGLNNCYFGDAEVDLHVFPTRQRQDTILPPQLQFHADVYRPTRTVVDLNGEARFDGSGHWKLEMDADSVPLAFVNHWTASVLRDLDGNGTGRIVVGGRKGLTYVLLRAEAQNASLTLPWTGVRYTIPHDTIVMDTTAILFPNVHLVDAEGHKVEVNGGVYHDQFRDFELDIHVDAHDALVFDQDKGGEMLQGKVYANGHVDVSGPEDDIKVTADAVTSSKSRFRLSIDNASSAYESGFIHFVQHASTVQRSTDTIGETDLDNIDFVRTAQTDSTLWQRAGRCLLTLNIEVNPQLLFQLVLGERNGDMIQGRGNGALRLSYDTETGDVRLLGTYDIDRGTLSYTIANVIRKEFTVGEGSTIVFSGDATNPELDVTAKYRVTASLKDLFGDEIDQLATTRTSIPVLTCLNLTGPLQNPILSFSLEFPTSDQAIQQQVRQVINTDEMMMRQVIYLLVFGRFFTPEYMSQAQYATLNSTYSLLSSTVTGQINAWLSKLTDILTLGVAIRTEGEGASASQEYEAQFQLQPVDRLIINGNVGYRYNDISNQPFFGDLDVEVLLTEDGQWRLKGYTHMVDKYSLRQASTIQGFGFLWKKDFNWPTPKKKKKNTKQ